MTNLKGSPVWCPKIPVQIHLLRGYFLPCTFAFLPVSALGRGWGGAVGGQWAVRKEGRWWW